MLDHSNLPWSPEATQISKGPLDFHYIYRRVPNKRATINYYVITLTIIVNETCDDYYFIMVLEFLFLLFGNSMRSLDGYELYILGLLWKNVIGTANLRNYINRSLKSLQIFFLFCSPGVRSYTMYTIHCGMLCCGMELALYDDIDSTLLRKFPPLKFIKNNKRTDR